MRLVLPFAASCAVLALFAPVFAQDAAPRIRYYLVEGAMMLPSGRSAGDSLSIVKRTTDSAAGQIEERVLSVRAGQPSREFVTILKPRIAADATTVAISAPEAGMEGEGQLMGDAWRWTHMRFTTRIPATKQTVDGEDRFTEDGMTAEKRVKDASGTVVVVIRETGRLISEGTYKLLREKLLGPAITR